MPVGEAGSSFNFCLRLVVERREEIHLRQTFHLVYAADGIYHRLLPAFVAIDEANGLGRALTAEHHLEESVRHPHLVTADGLLAATVGEQRTTDNVNGTVPKYGIARASERKRRRR